MTKKTIESFIEEIVRSAVLRTLQGSEMKKEIKPLVIANWKMNMTFQSIVPFMEKFSFDSNKAEVVICPTFPYLYPLKVVQDKGDLSFSIGAQNIHEQENGAYTGDVSADQLVDVGCRYCIIGHSERRAIGETNELINKKVVRSLSKDIIPVICIGETEVEWKQQKTKLVVKDQVLSALAGIQDISQIVIAYEPVWAIGTGNFATPEQAQDVHYYIRSVLKENFGPAASHIPILYGGSVKPENALEFSKMDDINGSLVGGASLKAEHFIEIISAFSKED